MIDEEVKELKSRVNKLVYFAGNIPERTLLDKKMLDKANEFKRADFEIQKDSPDKRDGEY